jgi:hypothetical protein
MSESTFSQPSSPTSGLQPYDLEPVPKEVYPAPTPGRRRNRHAAWRKRFLSRGSMNKGNLTMSHHTIEAMVDTLRKSVASIAKAPADQHDELLAKSFGEFQAVLKAEVDGELAKRAPATEDLLFKGYGCVGAVASMVSMIADKIQDIANGGPSWKSDGSKDPASEDMLDALDGLLMHAQGILHMAVNEHCVPGDEGDDDMHVVMVKCADGTDVQVKTHLPVELAKFAADPNDIDNLFAQVGFGVMAQAGVDPEVLSKALEGGELRKDAGMMGMSQETPDDGSGADIGMDDGNPLDTVSRLAALILITVDHINQQVNGTNEPTDPSGEDNGTMPADPSAATAAASGNDNPPTSGAAAGGPNPDDDNPVGKSAPGATDLAKLDITDEALKKLLSDRGIDVGALTKVAEENAALRGQVAEYEALSKALLSQPEAPKAPLITAAIEKGEENDLAKINQQPEEDLSKLSPQDRAMRLMKRQHQTAGKPYKG